MAGIPLGGRLGKGRKRGKGFSEVLFGGGRRLGWGVSGMGLDERKRGGMDVCGCHTFQGSPLVEGLSMWPCSHHCSSP